MLDIVTENSLYIVLAIAVVVWIGVFAYLVRLDRKLRVAERRLKK